MEIIGLPSGPPIDDTRVFELSREALDALPYGVITLDRDGTVLRYNETEAVFARRAADRTIGLNFFADVAPCTNVQAFRGRFDVFAAQDGAGVDRFDFSFAFRWGLHDVSITLLRKTAHAEINVLVRGRSLATIDPAAVAGVSRAASARDDEAVATGRPRGRIGRELDVPRTWRLLSPQDAEWRIRIHPDDRPMSNRIVARARAQRRPYALEYRVVEDDHSEHVYLEQGLFDGESALLSVMDVSEQRLREEDLWRAANYDEVTGLASRTLLLRRIGEAVREATSVVHFAAITFIGLDGLAAINDTFGHDIGDRILRAVALRLGECVRGGDTVARLNDTEFVVLTTGHEDMPMVERAARGILSAISRPIEVDGRLHHLTASVGVSITPHHGTDAAVLLRSADTAMSACKAAGRNGFQFYSPDMSAAVAVNVQTEDELRFAIERGELEAYYQPIIDVESGGVVAAETLVRWNHPGRGLIAPLEFIAIAERSGMISPVGEFVLQAACEQIVRWITGGSNMRVCINVSSLQFGQKNFTNTVRRILDETHAPPERVELELTESVMIEGFGAAMDTLSELKLMGLRLAVDDFGTGYSSLAYLKFLPIDTLKLDRTFITDIVADGFDRAIVTAVLALARDLRLDCIAEGVETLEQVELLRKLGCRTMQGYFFGRPQPARTFDARALLALR